MSDTGRPVLSILSALLIFAPSIWVSEAHAQSGCEGCSGSYQTALQAQADRDSCPEGREAFCYQAYLAAQNRFTNCLNRGCDTGIPTGNEPQSSGSGEGSGAADGAGDSGAVPDPDSDGDGVPDRADRCRGTAAGVVVDDKGCPAKILKSMLARTHPGLTPPFPNELYRPRIYLGHGTIDSTRRPIEEADAGHTLVT